MSAGALVPYAEELPVPAEAVDALRGGLPRYEELSRLSYAELVEFGRGLGETEMKVRLARAMAACDAVSRVGTDVLTRRAALEQYCLDIRYPIKPLQTDMRILRVVGPDDLAKYPDLTPGHFWNAAHLTSRPGEAPDAPARLARAQAALDEAQAENLTTKQLRERLEVQAAADAAGEVVCRQTDGSEVLAPVPEQPEPGSREDQRQRADHEARLRRLERLLDPPRIARDLARDLISDQTEFGSVSTLEDYLLKWLETRLGGAP